MSTRTTQGDHYSIRLHDGSRYDIRNAGPLTAEQVAVPLSTIRTFRDAPTTSHNLAELALLRCDFCPPEAQLHALLFRAHRAVLGATYASINEILDRLIPGARANREHAIDLAIYKGFGLGVDDFRAEVDRADTLATAVAARAVLGCNLAGIDWLIPEARGVELSGRCLSQPQAAAAFVQRFGELRGTHAPEVFQ